MLALNISLIMLGIYLISLIIRVLQTKSNRSNLAYEAGCEPVTRYPHKDPIFGLDLFLATSRAFKAGRFLQFHTDQFRVYGKTFRAHYMGNMIIKTSQPENFKAVYATSFDHFGMEPLRSGGTLSSFDTSNIQPFDGSTFDLVPLLGRLFLDTSTEFVFGKSTESLLRQVSPRFKEFLDAFKYAQRGSSVRKLLGRLSFLYRDKKWTEARAKIYAFCDVHVARVLDQQQKEKSSLNSHEENSQMPETNRKRWVLLE
ncbi:hypothetical protein MMC25_004178 [Agyrium rufum]|nr:hypothetical protein [Agyrium rufum]